MNELERLIAEIVAGETLHELSLTGPRRRGEGVPTRLTVRPVRIKNERRYQFERHVGGKTHHANLAPADAQAQLLQLLPAEFKQAAIRTTTEQIEILVNKRGEPNIKRRAMRTETAAVLAHDRKKQYILPEGTPCPFLAQLGVMTADGRVVAGKHDKFRQINRFLEMIRDVADQLPANQPINVIDFGCGKSYLTFALYHYLREILGLDVRITGLDLKADVIAHCNRIAADLNYPELSFQVGDIGGYRRHEPVDMVVALHACDTATDDALAQAVARQARVILAVPCCQHELYGQLENEIMQPLLKHGILKERLAALVTDGLRAQLLEIAGYAVQVLEFIEMEHTPKNLLIRAVQRRDMATSVSDEARLARYRRCRDFWHANPHLERALGDLEEIERHEIAQDSAAAVVK
jgi:SAM-dependent methyltransferase